MERHTAKVPPHMAPVNSRRHSYGAAEEDAGGPKLNTSANDVVTEVSINSPPVLVRQYHYIFLILFVLSCYIGVMAQFTILSQYIFHRFAVDADLPGGGTNTNESLCNINKSDPLYIEQHYVQQRASRFNGYASLASGLPALITTILFGTYSDRMGRRLTILVPWMGLLLQSIVLVLMMTLTWPIWLYPLAGVLCGLGGSYGAMLSGVFAFLADTTTHKQRSFAITCVEATLGIGAVISQFVVGWWIRLSGFIPPFIFFTCLLLSSAFYLICLPETVPRRRAGSQAAGLNPLSMLRCGIKVFTSNRSRGCLLLLCLLAVFTHIFIYIGLMGVTTLYALNRPFCWDSVELGYFRGAGAALMQFGTVTTVYIVRKRNWLRDVWLIVLGFASLTGTLVLTGIANTLEVPSANFILYASAFVGVFSGLPVPLIRAAMSKLVSIHEQGTMFASVGSLETLAIMLGGAGLNAIYEATVTVWPGFVFILSAVLSFLGLILMLVFNIREKKHEIGDREILINESEDS